MVAWKVAVLLPMLSASIRVNDEAIKLEEAEHHQEKQHLEVQVQKEEKQHAVKSKQANEPADGGEDQDPSAPDKCGELVATAMMRNSAWRRVDKCKCPKGEMLLDPLAEKDCEESGRYFRIDSAMKERGYTCGYCSQNCTEVVEGSVQRDSAWRRPWSSERCKCEAGFEVRGEDAACTSQNLTEGRKFSRKQFRNKGCSCMNSTFQEAEVTTTVAPTTAEPKTEPKGGAVRGAGGLAAFVALLAALLAGSLP